MYTFFRDKAILGATFPQLFNLTLHHFGSPYQLRCGDVMKAFVVVVFILIVPRLLVYRALYYINYYSALYYINNFYLYK